MPERPAKARQHVPERSCAGCRARHPKAELARLVKTPSGEIEIDREARRPGRGAYLCFDPACWQAGIARRGLDRALRLGLTAENRTRLLQALAEPVAAKGERR